MEKKKPVLAFGETFKNTGFILGRVWSQKAGKQYVILKGIRAVLDAIFPVAATVMPGLIVNELLAGTIGRKLIVYVAVLLLSPVLHEMLQVTLECTLFGLAAKITENNKEYFYQHANGLAYERLEQPQIQDQKNRAQKIMNNSLTVVEHMVTLFRSIVNLILNAYIISSLNLMITVFLIGVVLVKAGITRRLKQKNNEIENRIWDLLRRHWGFGFVLESFEYAKDIRMFRVGKMLIDKLLDMERRINSEKRQMEAEKYQAGLKTELIVAANDLFLYIYLIYRVVRTDLAVGSVTIFLSVANLFSGSLNDVAESYLALSAAALKTNELKQFLNMIREQNEGGKLTPILDKDSVIEFKNVSFRYLGSQNFAVHNLNLTLYGNQKLCIVGENGAGKSTFIKLLTRLYSPTEGEIFLNGVNIKEYDYKKYQRLFAPVFQECSIFHLTLEDNIVLAGEQDSEKLDRVCMDSGLMPFIEKQSQKYNTQLSKWYDEKGIELSGGERQRVAIARACYHGGEMYLLDEPTSALDPCAEYEIYRQFNQMISGKCAVLITHRLAAAQLADQIAVFHNGEIAEYGTHKELYKRGGLYTEMFDKQAQFYRDDIRISWS